MTVYLPYGIIAIGVSLYLFRQSQKTRNARLERREEMNERRKTLVYHAVRSKGSKPAEPAENPQTAPLENDILTEEYLKETNIVRRPAGIYVICTLLAISAIYWFASAVEKFDNTSFYTWYCIATSVVVVVADVMIFLMRKWGVYLLVAALVVAHSIFFYSNGAFQLISIGLDIVMIGYLFYYFRRMR